MRHIRLVKGGWNINFIVNNKYVFKIHKKYTGDDDIQKIIREKRITDAFAPIVNLKIPHIEIVNAGEYTFYKYDFIPGQNLNKMPLRRIRRYRMEIGAQIGEFIRKIHTAAPREIANLANPSEPNANGWIHADICNNVIVNPKTMRVVAVIDWEYASFGRLETEFRNCTLYSRKMRESGILEYIRRGYESSHN
jgi:hypothetical protein